MPERSRPQTDRDPAWELLERLIEHLQSEIGSVSEPKFADIMRALEMKLKYGDRGEAERTFWKLTAALRREIYGKHFKEDDTLNDCETEAAAPSVVAIHTGSGAAGGDGGGYQRCAQHPRGRRG